MTGRRSNDQGRDRMHQNFIIFHDKGIGPKRDLRQCGFAFPDDVGRISADGKLFHFKFGACRDQLEHFC
jgi:hypothetical protein